jgi:hypothetical protein
MFRGKKTTFGMGWGVAQWQDAGLACEALSWIPSMWQKAKNMFTKVLRI